MTPQHLVVVGAGWAGCAAALFAARRGCRVTLIEATRQWGGRARALHHGHLSIDNGQHILIGAYSATLALIHSLGLDEQAVFKRIPMQLRQANGRGFAVNATLRQWPRLATGWAVIEAKGWNWADKLSLARVALSWEWRGFACEPRLSVSELCADLTQRVMHDLIEPLCVSALNTPAHEASAQVFLRVLKDALFAQPGGSDFLLPRVDLSALLPSPAVAELTRRGGTAALGERALSLHALASGWRVECTHQGLVADAVIVASPPHEAARLAMPHHPEWAKCVLALQHESIATVYAQLPGATGAVLAHPVLALASSAARPAQFVFDRGQLGGPLGLLAFVVSASHGNASDLTHAVLTQASDELGLTLQPIQTVVEKRATFACKPQVQRATSHIANRLWAAGDHVAGPYPATLEGAVRSAQVAVDGVFSSPFAAQSGD